MPESDPRIFFAAERTLLAWLRTGITIIALGFVVSRFGLFLQLLSAQSQTPSTHSNAHSSTLFGVMLSLIGAACIAVAAFQHGRFIATLPAHDRPAGYSRHWAVALSVAIALAGIGLSAYMLATLP